MIDKDVYDLSYLLFPRSVAVISATFEAHQVGGRVLLNIQKSKYQGKVYPVSAIHDEIFGIKAFPNLISIPEEVDTVVITLPPESVLPILNECTEKKVKFVIIPSFDSIVLEDEMDSFKQILKTFSEETGIRVLGPNSPGIFNITKSICISPARYYELNRFQSGMISLISQGEGLGRTILDANDRGIGFNHWISTGNEADLEIADFIHYFAGDSSTRIILVIVERLKDELKFLKAAKAAMRAGKPLIVLNIGQARETKDVSPFQDEVKVCKQGYPALLTKFGIIQVYDLDELIHVSWLFLKYGTPKGNRVGIFSFSDGIETLFAGKCRQVNLPVPDLSDETKSLFKALLPELGVISNPISLKTYIYQDMFVIRECLEQFTNDPNLDLVVVIFPFKLGIYTEMLARLTVERAQQMNKPIILLWTSLSGELDVSYEILSDSGLPLYSTANGCINAIKYFIDYSK